ncbi:NUDIX domain-containing protein [Paenibacillus sp. GSMTC-2017]|uniref:NUDIX domain-containing protein n=1 Tax=Paenibacillus sp. GSMTC-2017 TaxID=2794350 RepID=UPI0018D731AC|nr:NUDIX domain-containing protein [Paenibacillus sp. GSMTC-2017]
MAAKPGEKLIDCLIRECCEETGYLVEVHKLVYMRECFMDENVHRVECMFTASIIEETETTNMDHNQLGVEWIELSTIKDEPLFPKELRRLIESLHQGNHEQVYLGEIE